MTNVDQIISLNVAQIARLTDDALKAAHERCTQLCIDTHTAWMDYAFGANADPVQKESLWVDHQRANYSRERITRELLKRMDASR